MWVGRGDSSTMQWDSPERVAWEKWSGIRESNPRLDLGKVAYYHYTNPARSVALPHCMFYSMPPTREQALEPGLHSMDQKLSVNPAPWQSPGRYSVANPLP